jgi:hypothetical protein
MVTTSTWLPLDLEFQYQYPLQPVYCPVLICVVSVFQSMWMVSEDGPSVRGCGDPSPRDVVQVVSYL